MSRRRRSPIQNLRLVIDCLPVRTRIAMLEGITVEDIIVGAYTDEDVARYVNAFETFAREVTGR